MKDIIITNHAFVRMLERTPFPQECYQTIVERAFSHYSNISGNVNDTTSIYLTHLIEDTVRDREGIYTARIYSKYIYLFVESNESIRLVTVFENDQKNLINYIKKGKLGW